MTQTRICWSATERDLAPVYRANPFHALARSCDGASASLLFISGPRLASHVPFLGGGKEQVRGGREREREQDTDWARHAQLNGLRLLCF